MHINKNDLLHILLKVLYDYVVENSNSTPTDYYRGKRDGMLEIIEKINSISEEDLK